METTKKKYNQHLIAWVSITVVLVAGAYLVGNKHGIASAKPTFGRGGTALSGPGARMGGGRFGAGAGLVTGTVLSKDTTSITIQAKDGSSKIVLYSGSTQVLKSTAGSVDDIAVGSQVSAQGTQNSDGSVTAASIQIRPAMPAK